VDRAKRVGAAVTGGSLWLVILVPILAISWLGFYTIARAVGVPMIFAMGMSAAYDGVAIFAARIGLKHRRKGFSGYLARITVVVFAVLGAFVQSFHSETTLWVHEHAWLVWATAPVAAVLAYELHLGWVHRKQLIRHGYVHPSAKSGYGPATWFLIGGTFTEYRDVLRARRDFITKGNRERFQTEESAQPELRVPVPPKPKPVLPRPNPKPRPVPQGQPGPRLVHSRSTRPSSKPARTRPTGTSRPVTKNMEVAAWWVAQGGKLGYNNRVPIEGLRAYRRAHPEMASAS
jgi:hypothetical protein